MLAFGWCSALFLSMAASIECLRAWGMLFTVNVGAEDEDGVRTPNTAATHAAKLTQQVRKTRP